MAAAATLKDRGGTSPSEMLAASALQQADAILVCAGAGMSIHDSETSEATHGNVYIDPEHFKHHYPCMAKAGYNTCYETMGLRGDPSVPAEVKKGFLLMHMHNMCIGIAPTPGYSEVLKLCRRVEAQGKARRKGGGSGGSGSDDSDDDDDAGFFVWTSNVDGCFERSGFPADRIYTPQGAMKWFQCFEPACRGVYWSAEAAFKDVLPLVDRATCRLPAEQMGAQSLRCPRCGTANTFANLRGGGWFSHHAELEAAADRLAAWLGRVAAAGKRLVVVEVGAGMNTPTVTRLPMEAVARSFPGAVLIRMNPSDPAVGQTGLPHPRGMSLADGWRSVGRINALLDRCEAEAIDLSPALRAAQGEPEGQEEEGGGAGVAPPPPASFDFAGIAAAAAREHAALNSSGRRAAQWQALSQRYERNPWRAYLDQLRR